MSLTAYENTDETTRAWALYPDKTPLVSIFFIKNHPCLFFKRDSLPDNYWTNENVSFGARNYECLSKKCSQRNVARFVHVECRFDKIKDIVRVLEASLV